MGVRRRNKRDQQGAVAVEFALVFPLFVALLFGVTTLGATYNDHLAISNAAREGARYGSAIDYTAAGWGTSVRDRVKQVYFNDLDEGKPLTNSQICVDLEKSDGTTLASYNGGSCGPEPASPSTVAGSCAVKVWIQRPHTIQVLVFPDMDIDIHADIVSYYGRTVSPGCPAQ